MGRGIGFGLRIGGRAPAAVRCDLTQTLTRTRTLTRTLALTLPPTLTLTLALALAQALTLTLAVAPPRLCGVILASQQRAITSTG